MDEHPLAELGHLHKKTLARFQASMDEYQFIVQQKSSAGLPAELKTTSTWAVNTFGPTCPNSNKSSTRTSTLSIASTSGNMDNGRLSFRPIKFTV